MKTKFSLTNDDLMVLQTPGLPAESANQIWHGVCKRVGCQFATLEDAKTGDPREFLAEPAAPEPPGEEVVKVATSADNALVDSLCAGRNLAQRGIFDTHASNTSEQRILAALANKPSGTGEELRALNASEREVWESCRQIEKVVTGPFFGDGPFKTGEWRVFRQERIWLPNSGKPGFLAHWGEPHAVFKVGDKALIVQYNVLNADVLSDWRKMQLLDLVVLVAGHYAPLDRVSTVVIQPLVTQTPEIVTYELSSIEDSYKDMIRRISASNHPGATRTPGEVQCKSCKAVGTCNENRVWRAAQQPPVAPKPVVIDPPVLEPPVYPPKKKAFGWVTK